MPNNENTDLVYGRGPVRELLRGERQVECLLLQKGLEGGVPAQLAAMAKNKGLPVKQIDAQGLDKLCGGANHQGVAAQVSAMRYAELDDIFRRAGDEPVLLVVADEIEDPHNLGAIIRTAEAAGAHGLIIPKRRSAGLSQTVVKTSAGATEPLPVARVPNLPTVIEDIKVRGVWVYGADAKGKNYQEVDFSGPAALVLGSEGRGLGRLVRERCDDLVSLPMHGKMTSLNVSVAAGILLYEIARTRNHNLPEAHY